jgi:hypothetical protein
MGDDPPLQVYVLPVRHYHQDQCRWHPRGYALPGLQAG